MVLSIKIKYAHTVNPVILLFDICPTYHIKKLVPDGYGSKYVKLNKNLLEEHIEHLFDRGS